MKLVVLILLLIILFIVVNKSNQKEFFTNGRKMAVLIHTFDGYSRYWKPLLYFTNKYLNIDYDIYIGVEDMDIPQEILGRVKILKSGKGSFVDRLESHLNKLEEKGYKYIYLMQVDHWYTKHTSHGIKHNKIFDDCINFMEKNKIDCLKLHQLSMLPFNVKNVDKYPNKLLNKNLYYPNKKYKDRQNLGISHNGCIVTLKLLKHSCDVTKLKGYSTAKGHEYATVSKEFGNVKRKRGDTGLNILQTDRENTILQFEHVGYGGKLNVFGKNALKNEKMGNIIDEMNSQENQIRKRQEIR